MEGIVAYGAYIPIYRLSRDAMGKAWGVRGAPGERSMANFDEDSITMAVEAALDCINGIDRKKIDALFFASTTSPYKEKQCSTLIATAADLGNEITTSDFAGTLRAGTGALKAALAAVKSGAAKNVLVVAADCRVGEPGSPDEQSFGDGAAAFLIASEGVATTIEDSYSIADEITDVWRTDEDSYVHSWEGRWVMTQGYARHMRQAISGIMKKNNLAVKDFAKAVFYGPDDRSHGGLGRGLGFDGKTQVQDPLLATVGNTGTAHSLMTLVAALEEAKSGDRILLANYGDGSDAFILKVSQDIEKIKDRRGVKGYLASKLPFASYATYCDWRKVLTTAERPAISSASLIYRDRASILRLHASRCKRCSMTFFPIQRVCFGCGVKDQYEEVRLSDRKGKVFTYAKDYMVPIGAPNVATVVEMEDGCRAYMLMTDRDPDKVEVGMPVEFTFRRWNEGAGFYNYFWKCRPLRGGK
jgi:3-hydroxy-3-methylglutaryl CoA synthase